MPVTPFHFGPGFLVKSVARKRFSFFVFIFSQVIIDTESVRNIIQGSPRIHTFFHTFLGSWVAVGIASILAKPLARGLAFFLKPLPTVQRWGITIQSTSWTVILTSALVGGGSHIILDGIMHYDLQPFAPFTTANPFLGLVSLATLHSGCILAGVLGGAVWLFSSKAV